MRASRNARVDLGSKRDVRRRCMACMGVDYPHADPYVPAIGRAGGSRDTERYCGCWVSHLAAYASPFSAAALSQRRAAASSRGTPVPARYTNARLLIAGT